MAGFLIYYCLSSPTNEFSNLLRSGNSAEVVIISPLQPKTLQIFPTSISQAREKVQYAE